jgi:hypothetical protein
LLTQVLQRVTEEGIRLHSELPDSEKPVAKLSDLFSRRFSIEAGLDSQQTPPTTGDANTSGPADYAPTKKIDDLVVQDIDSAKDEISSDKVSGKEEKAEDLSESDSEPVDIDTEPDADDSEAIIFTDPADAIDEPPTAFVIAEEPKVEDGDKTKAVDGDDSRSFSPTGVNSPDTTKSLTDMLDAAETSAEDDNNTEAISAGSDRFLDPSGKNLSLEEYLLQPIDIPSVRQSISAKHLATRRKTVVDNDIASSAAGSKLIDVVFNRIKEQQEQLDAFVAKNEVTTVVGHAESAQEPSDLTQVSAAAVLSNPEVTATRVIGIEQIEVDEAIDNAVELAVDEEGESFTLRDHTYSPISISNNIKYLDEEGRLEATLDGLKSLKGFVETSSSILEARTTGDDKNEMIVAEIRDTLKSIMTTCKAALREEIPEAADTRMSEMLEKYSEMLVSLVGQKLSSKS